ADLDRQTIDELVKQGVSIDSIVVQGKAHLRYAGTDTALPVFAYNILRKIKDSIVVASMNPLPDSKGFSVSESDLTRPNPDGGPTTDPIFQLEPSVEFMKTAFEKAHKAQFGFIDETKQIVVEALSVEAIGGGNRFTEPVLPVAGAPLPAPAQRTRFYS